MKLRRTLAFLLAMTMLAAVSCGNTEPTGGQTANGQTADGQTTDSSDNLAQTTAVTTVVETTDGRVRADVAEGTNLDGFTLRIYARNSLPSDTAYTIVDAEEESGDIINERFSGETAPWRRSITSRLRCARRP